MMMESRLTSKRRRIAPIAGAFVLFFVLGFAFGGLLTYLAALTGANVIALALLLFLLPAATTHGLFKWAERLSRPRRPAPPKAHRHRLQT